LYKIFKIRERFVLFWNFLVCSQLKNTSCSQSESDAIVSSSSKGSNLGLVQSLMALVLPKKLSYSATFVYVGMRLLKYNFKEY
jgi:hypothetical protein